MTGNNKITLCPAEMNKALQHYFDTKLFRKDAAPKVVSVAKAGGINDGVYEINVEESKGY